MKRILVPIDFSAHSVAAAGLAYGIARSHGARLALYHAVDPLEEVEVPPVSAEAMQQDSAGQARRELGRLAELLRSDALEMLVEHADPAAGILAAAAEPRADLI